MQTVMVICTIAHRQVVEARRPQHLGNDVRRHQFAIRLESDPAVRDVLQARRMALGRE
jgi:hypothetical protein